MGFDWGLTASKSIKIRGKPVRKFISALAFGALLIPGYGFTLGMGEIEVNSALNQQLNARIELISSVPEDAETLIVNLASREEFSRAGLDRPYGLTSLRFKPVVEGGQLYIKVTSPKPIREPFLNFLIEVDWPKGHMLREYTILLDPPVFMGQPDSGSSRPAVSQPETAAPAPAQSLNETVQPSGFRPASGVAVAAPVPSAPIASEPVQSAPTARQSQTFVPVVAPQQQTSYSSPSGDSSDYRIQAGETAWSLADSMRPDQSVSVQQMMLAMLRINPEVFINGNVNGLKKGYILRIPDRAEITSVSQEEAKAMVVEQNALWREYQQALAVDEPASSIADDDVESEYGSGIRSSEDEARLSIVSAGSGESASEAKDPTQMTEAELREQLALAREELETARVENEGLEGDLGSLEQRVETMQQSLLEIEDASMAEIQSTAEGEEAVAEDAAGMSEEEITSEEEAALAALDELTGEEAIEIEEVSTEEEAVEGEAITEGEEIAEGEEVFIDEMAGLEEVQDSEVVVDEIVPVSVAPREETGLMASLLGNPLIAGGAALLVLILLAVGYILAKRRRDSAGDDAEASLVTDIEQGQGLGTDLEEVADSVDDAALDDFVSDEEVENSMAEAEANAETEEESFDSEATMILPDHQDTVVTQAEPQAEEEARDDVIAEADVYLAYGIYQQAEELLQSAINDNPDKDSYRVKLAETYFAGKNTDGLTQLGTEMKARLSGEETSAWKKVAAMGKELCPDADIFQQAGAVAELDIDDLMPKSPEPMDFDLGDDSGENAPDLDMDFGSPDDSSSADVPIDETIAIPEMEETAPVPAVDEVDELEFDIGEAEAVAEEKDAAEDEFSLDIEASELDIQDEETFALAEEDSVEIDSSELDFDMDLSDDSSTTTTAAPASEDVDLSDLGDADEINTKLDLAKAYIDMGDHEGARDILDEVIAGGDDAQKKEAKDLLSQVG